MGGYTFINLYMYTDSYDIYMHAWLYIYVCMEKYKDI